MSLAATVDGAAVLIDEIDAREAALRASPQADTLPRPNTSEGRQLRRWLTQLLVTERVIAHQAHALGGCKGGGLQLKAGQPRVARGPPHGAPRKRGVQVPKVVKP